MVRLIFPDIIWGYVNMHVAGNIFGQQWPLGMNGSSTNPAVNFSGAGQSGISLGISNTLSLHALGNTPLIITANGMDTTGVSVLTTPANVTPTPVIATTIQIADASGTVMDDLALDASNGGFLKITGTGFGGGTVVSVGNMIATATTLVSTTQLIAQVQPRAAGTYPVTITRPDGPFFTVPTGISFSPFPVWSTSSTLANVIKYSAFTQTLATTESLGSNITYAIANGSSLPANVTLASNGVLSGNITENPGNTTTYFFTLDAVDAQFQNIPRSFGLTALASFISASGGTITTSGAYKIHTFTTSGTFTIASNPGSRTFEVLVVAGGGGGGGSHGGGGGGGGGVVSSTGVVAPNGVYTITVGGGGTGGSAPVAGNDSSALGLTAVGGGRGGQETNAPGGNGGSGGGGSGDTNAPYRAAGSGTAGQGYGGGTGNNTIASTYGVGGGGGGAGQVGANATNSGGGNGGNGVSSSISGSVVYYAGGGGGGGWVGIVNGGIGGLGGGGNTVSGSSGLPGTPNSGGGGAGSDASASPRNGGNGGAGIVIIRYIM